MMSRLLRLPWATFAFLAGATLIVLLALYVVVAGQLLSLLEQRRTDVALWVGARVGMIATIDAIDTDMRLLTPVVHLRGVRLFVPDGGADAGPALVAPVIDLELDTLATALARRPVLQLLRLEGIDLVLEEREDGRFHVRGMPFNVNDPQAEEKLRQALQVLYRQTDIVVEHSRLTIESARLPVTALEKLRLHMHNDGDRHAVSGSAQVLGPGRLSAAFVLNFAGAPVLPRDLQADLYLRLAPAPLEGWLPRREAGQLWIDSLTGGGEAWLRLEHGRVLSVTGLARVDSLAASLADGRKIEGLLGLQTRYRWRAQDDGFTLALSGLTFRRQGLAWPETDGAIEVRRLAVDGLGTRSVDQASAAQASADLERADLEADTGAVDTRVDAAAPDEADPGPGSEVRLRAMLSRGSVQMLAALADALPENQTALRAQLQRWAPTGQLADLRLDWDPSAPASKRWQLSSAFAGIAINSDGTAPGISGLAGRVELHPDAGYARLVAERAQLWLPTIYDAPVAVTDAAVRAVWRRDGAGWRLATDRFRVSNGDAAASGLLTLQLPGDGSSPRLALLAQLQDGRGTRAASYLPRSASAGLRNWLDTALVDARVQRGTFVFEGPVRREPAALAERTFQMRFAATGMTLAYLPGWPPLRHADADIHIADGVVDARGISGRVLGSALGNIRVRVTPAGPRTPSLLVATSAINGDVADTFALFRDTPLHDAVPAELLRWDGTGRLAADLRLELPLGVPAATPQVTVTGTVAGATLASTLRELEITDVSGALRYDTRQGFSATEVRGRALASEFTGSARTVNDDGGQQTLIDLRGSLQMAPLSAWLQLPALDLLRGDAESLLQLRFARDGSLLDVRSNLRGIAVSAPAPLGKPADSAVDTRFTYTLGTSTPRLTLVYGRNFAADVQLRDGAPVAGMVALGSTRLPEAGDSRTRGLVVEGSMPTLVVADWLAFSRRLAGLPPLPAPAAKEPFAVSRAVAGLVALGNTLQRVNVSTERLDAGLLVLEGATVRMGRETGSWLIGVDSRVLRGQIVMPDGYEERGSKPLVVQIDTLNLPAAAATRLGGNGEPLPAAIPRLALALNNISIGSENYGSWSLETVPDGTGVLLNDLHGSWRALDIQGSGRWAPAPEGGTRTQFTGVATADDLARVSEAFGFAPNLSSAQAKMKFDLGWPGSPLRADPLLARGTLALDLSAGRFVTQSAKTQALRAFGVFNISTWQRRMKLDFTDLYKKGVAFDQLTGDLVLDGGRVSTSNLVVKGPSALFEGSGSTDLASHAISSRLRVTLPLNSNLYVGCLAGLPACAGIVAFEQLWGDRLEKMTTLSYDVSGVWEDPQIRLLDDPGREKAEQGRAQNGEKAGEKTGDKRRWRAPTKPAPAPAPATGG